MADHVVDIGPGAGVHGGEIIAEGTPQDIMANPESLTGQYLTGQRAIPLPTSGANSTSAGSSRCAARAATI